MGGIEFIFMHLTDIFCSFKEIINFIGSLSASIVTIYLGYLTLRKSVRFIGYNSYNSVWNGSSYSVTLFNNSLSAVCINKILLVFDSNEYLTILSREFNESITIEPRRIIKINSNPVSKYINNSKDKLNVKGIIVKYATGEYVFYGFRYNGILQWIKNKLNSHMWIREDLKSLNEIRSISTTFGGKVIGSAVKYIVDITDESNLSNRIYILRNGTLSQWISNGNRSLGSIDNQYLNNDSQLGEFLKAFFELNKNIGVSIYNMDDIY